MGALKPERTEAEWLVEGSIGMRQGGSVAQPDDVDPFQVRWTLEGANHEEPDVHSIRLHLGWVNVVRYFSLGTLPLVVAATVLSYPWLTTLDRYCKRHKMRRSEYWESSSIVEPNAARLP